MSRIVIIIGSLQCGGAERTAVILAEEWAGRGHDVLVATWSGEETDHYRLPPPVRRLALRLQGGNNALPVAAWRNVRRILALRRVLREESPCVAIGFMETANVILALASWCMRGITTIGTEHNFPPRHPQPPIWEWLRRVTYRRLGTVTALTQESLRWLRENTSARTLVRIPNPCVWPLPDLEPKVAPALVCRPGRKLVLAAGRFVPQKGFDLLLRAFSSIASRNPEWDLAILGKGPLRQELASQVEACGLSNRVHFPGVVGNIGDWYLEADLFVLSSRYEGFVNVVFEAMSYGVAVVSFDCDTGPRDMITHGIDGLLVAPESVEELAAAMDRMMGDASLRESLAHRAIEVRERLSASRISKEWEERFFQKNATR